MTSPHGTISRFTNGPCSCAACRQAKKVYEGKRGLGQVRTFVLARPARTHVRFLLTHGWSAPTLAAHIGVSSAAIKWLAAGRSARVDAVTAERVLGAHTGNAPYRTQPRHGGGQRFKWEQDAVGSLPRT